MRDVGGSVLVLALASGLLLAAPHSQEALSSSSTFEQAYLAETRVAMTRMMDGMSMKALGDVDRDFARMMIPHHQGAIDMAMAVLRYGHNEKIRRLAQEIIVDQQQEIAAMHLAVGDSLPPAAPAPTRSYAGEPKH